MRGFVIGILLGICLDTTVTAIAKDYLNRSPQQQQYRGVWHHLSERPEGRCAQMVLTLFCAQRQLDIEHVRKQLDQQAFDRKYNRRPC